MKKILTTLFLTLLIAGSVIICSAAPEPKAGSAIMASLTSEQIIFGKNPDITVAPAEFTKLMTAYTTYRLYGFETTITVDDTISIYTDYRDASMKLKAGEQITSGDLIKGMLTEQANDAVYAVILAYGTTESFVAKMNEYANELGMENTVFTNPTGKEDSKQYTTANDLLKLYRAYYKDKKLYSVISEKNVTIPATNLSETRQYWTKNHLMSRFIYLDYMYDYATAGVSSSTSYGGYSVISSAVKGDRELVCIVLNSVKEENVNCAMTDAQNLFEYGFNEFKTVDLVKLGELLHEANVKNGNGKDTLLLCADRSLKAEILKTDDTSAVVREITINEPIGAPVKKGDIVGSVVYTYKGNFVGKVNLVAEQDVDKSLLKSFFGGISWFFGLTFVKVLIFIGVAFFVIMFISAYLRAKRRRIRRRNKRRKYKKF